MPLDQDNGELQHLTLGKKPNIMITMHLIYYKRFLVA